MKRMLTALPAAAATLALTGCGGVSPDDTYSSAEELQDALNSEDFRCTGDEVDSFDEGYAESIVCDEGTEVLVWEEDAPEYVSGPGVIRLGSALDSTRYHILSTEQWLIRSTNAGMVREMAPVFGGQYYGPDDDLRCEFGDGETC